MIHDRIRALKMVKTQTGRGLHLFYYVDINFLISWFWMVVESRRRRHALEFWDKVQGSESFVSLLHGAGVGMLSSCDIRLTYCQYITPTSAYWKIVFAYVVWQEVWCNKKILDFSKGSSIVLYVIKNNIIHVNHTWYNSKNFHIPYLRWSSK